MEFTRTIGDEPQKVCLIDFAHHQEEQTDYFTIEVEDVEFRVNRSILVANSDYFERMFAHKDFEESQSNRVKLEDISHQTVRSLLDFFYTRRLNLADENIEYLLIAANRFQIKLASDISDRYLAHMDNDNCFRNVCLAKIYGHPQLFKQCLEFCSKKFRFLTNAEEFQLLDADTLACLVSRDDINIYSEFQIFQAIETWFCHDKERRAQHLDALVGHLRFDLIDKNTLIREDFANSQVAKHSRKFRELRYAKVLLTFPWTGDIDSTGDSLERPKVGSTREKVQNHVEKIYAIGGQLGEGRIGFNVEIYDPQRDEWTEIEHTLLENHRISAAVIDDSIFVTGGGYNRISRYDILTASWGQDKEISYKEDLACGVIQVVAHKKELHSVGFLCTGFRVDGCFRIHSLSPRVHAPIGHTPWLFYSEVHPISIGDDLYLIGVPVLDYSTSGQRYNPLTKEYSDIKSMSTGRYSFGCATLGGKIYVAGGKTKTKIPLKTAECYDPSKDEWTEISAMNEARSYLTLVEAGGLIYAIGRQGRREGPNRVEAYDPKTDKWTSRNSMKTNRWRAAYVKY